MMTSYSAAEVMIERDLPPVLVEDVSEHTEGVVRSYFNYRLHNDSEYIDQNFDEDFIADIHTGQRLASVAEELDRYTGPDLERLVQRVVALTGPTASDDDWFAAFRFVVDEMLVGGFSWTKLVLIFCFGYRLLQKAWQNGWRPTLGLVSGVVIRYFLQERILRWIARHGGWLGANCMIIAQSMDLPTHVAVCVGSGIAAALLSFSVLYFIRRRALTPP